MENRINIAKLLKDCPKGMELDCAMYEDCEFLDIDTTSDNYLIRIKTPCGIKYLDKYGCYTTDPKAKCVIFPKGKTTWEGFHRPFKDGDVVFSGFDLISIFKEQIGGRYGRLHSHVSIRNSCVLEINKDNWTLENIRFATEEERQKLFDAIKSNGYRWNAETKILVQEFKDGDIVATKNGIFIGIVKVKNNMQVGAYCAINEIGTLSINVSYVFERLATEEERQKLFKAIKDNGYKWNAETKILVQEFKDGDIIAEDDGRICIYKNDGKIKNTANYYCGILFSGDFRIKDEKYPTRHFGPIEYYHLATEEEKQKLFDAIKANGFRWNSETKTLEKLVNPNFKVGNKIIRKGRKGIDYPIEVLAIENGRYKLPAMSMPIDSQDEWELVSDKFDITTLKPFGEVLVRNDDSCVWKCNLYSHYSEYPHHYICMDTGYKQCIPYNSNEHLVGTTNDCSDFYKTWEK